MSDAPQKRQLPIWLGISLMVNLALLGLAAGMLINRGHHRPPMPKADRSQHHITSHEDRRMVGRVMREAFIKAEPELRDRRVARKALGDVVNQEPFNAEAVSAAVAQLRGADRAVHEVLDSMLVARLDSMTLEQRTIIAGSLARDPSDRSRIRRGGKHRRKWRGDAPPPPPDGLPPFADSPPVHD